MESKSTEAYTEEAFATVPPSTSHSVDSASQSARPALNKTAAKGFRVRRALNPNAQPFIPTGHSAPVPSSTGTVANTRSLLDEVLCGREEALETTLAGAGQFSSAHSSESESSTPPCARRTELRVLNPEAKPFVPQVQSAPLCSPSLALAGILPLDNVRPEIDDAPESTHVTSSVSPAHSSEAASTTAQQFCESILTTDGIHIGQDDSQIQDDDAPESILATASPVAPLPLCETASGKTSGTTSGTTSATTSGTTSGTPMQLCWSTETVADSLTRPGDVQIEMDDDAGIQLESEVENVINGITQCIEEASAHALIEAPS